MKSKKKKKSKKRDLIEIGLILGIFGVLYFTGLHTDVAGFLQRGILQTGIHNTGELSTDKNLGQASYSFGLQGLNGEPASLEEFRGKVVFLNFWATWCPPCVAEMPDIQDLYNKVDRDQVVFVMVSVDEDPEKAQRFISKKGFDFPVYFPQGSVPAAFSSDAIPATFVISPEGTIAFKKSGMANYNTKDFRNFLKALANERQDHVSVSARGKN